MPGIPLDFARKGTPHNAALKGDIAPIVLMPGDPLRARHLALDRLEGAREVNGIRGMLAFTGTFEGRPVSVMGSGMGAPSMGIYSYELFAFYGVESVVRIGTCGGLTETLEVGDIAFAMSASSDSAYADQYGLPGHFSPSADYGLLEVAVAKARELGARHWVGSVFSSDVFSLYSARPADEGWKKWARMGCAATDMESYALYCNAAWLGKRALAMFTCSDNNVTGRSMDAEDRQTRLDLMFDIALALVP